MEEFVLSDLQTKEPINLQYSKPTIVLFFSLKEILLIKEVNKDILSQNLEAVSIYIGEDAKKVFLWKQKEEDCMPAYHGGSTLQPWAQYQIQEIPWILLINNNQIVYSNNLSAIQNPLIKNLLKRFPEFQNNKTKVIFTDNEKIKNAYNDNIDKILNSASLTTEEKIAMLENISNQGVTEMQQLRKELQVKDKIIKDIMHKL